MRNIWRPLGRVVSGALGLPWSVSHASNPTALPLADDNIRIFFSTRDAHNRSSAAFVDVAINGSGFAIVRAPHGPVLGGGARGAFDADGVTLSCVVPYDGQLYGFYLGWTVLRHVPFSNSIGLAISNDRGETFARHSVAPVIGRCAENPFSLGYPFVMRDGTGWRMWFGSHLCWGPTGLEMTHVIKEAYSPDLVSWNPSSRIVVDVAGLSDPREFAVSRPSLIREPDGSVSMWYARRQPNYQLGFAHSDDGVHWQRRDENIRFLGSPEDWESSERTYPFVFDHRGRRYMLYNGNGYGRDGFGLALLEE